MGIHISREKVKIEALKSTKKIIEGRRKTSFEELKAKSSERRDMDG